ncbi:MAG: hypothetical protein KDD25_07005, partial [Bdellovibrionales bacterium]|nr:hypothetical protein [Bdellovibrionales bacterium]
MQNFDKSKKSGLGRGLGSLLGGDLDDIKIEPTLRNDTVSKKPESQASTPELKQALADRIPVEKVPPESRIWNIAIEKIAPNPKQ